MSDDIIERLRRYGSGTPDSLLLMRKAADEIADLRARLEQAEARCRYYEDALHKAAPIVASMRAIIKSECEAISPTVENGEPTNGA